MKWRTVPVARWRYIFFFWKIIASVLEQTGFRGGPGKQLGNVEHCITLTLPRAANWNKPNCCTAANADSGGCIFVFSGEQHERLKFLIAFSTSRDDYCCVSFTNVPVSEARVYDAAREKEREMRGRKEARTGGRAITGTGECFRKTSRGPQGPPSSLV